MACLPDNDDIESAGSASSYLAFYLLLNEVYVITDVAFFYIAAGLKFSLH
ncbi:5321_t:CDS:1, partial [Gigaspora rosea]